MAYDRLKWQGKIIIGEEPDDIIQLMEGSSISDHRRRRGRGELRSKLSIPNPAASAHLVHLFAQLRTGEVFGFGVVSCVGGGNGQQQRLHWLRLRDYGNGWWHQMVVAAEINDSGCVVVVNGGDGLGRQTTVVVGGGGPQRPTLAWVTVMMAADGGC